MGRPIDEVSKKKLVSTSFTEATRSDSTVNEEMPVRIKVTDSAIIAYTSSPGNTRFLIA